MDQIMRKQCLGRLLAGSVALCAVSAVVAEEAGNGVQLNGLSLNGLNLKPLTRLSTDKLMSDEDGRELVRVITECALSAGDSFAIEAQGKNITFPGVLGLAPEWKNGVLSPSGQRWVTACVLAHVNNFGSKVPISLRGTHRGLGTTEAELAAYTVEEGAFYGNLFSDTPFVVSCSGRQGGNIDVSSDLDSRVCANETMDVAVTACGFTSAGACEVVCQTTDEGQAKAQGYSACQNGADTISEVITVFLRAN